MIGHSSFVLIERKQPDVSGLKTTIFLSIAHRSPPHWFRYMHFLEIQGITRFLRAFKGKLLEISEKMFAVHTIRCGATPGHMTVLVGEHL